MKTDKAPHNEKQGTYSKISSYLGAASATIIQTTATHPLDTISKRLQNNKDTKFSLLNARASMKNLYLTVYPTSTTSIWAGYNAALTYRVTANTITFGSQPLIKRYLDREYGYTISQITGENYKSTATSMLSGAMLGLIEVTSLPLDRWKVLRQVNNTTPFFTLIKHEKNTLYAGAFVTGLRNLKAFPALYGISDLSNKYFPPVDTVPFYQRVISSCAGAIAAVIVSNPLDVVKTRVQAQSYPLKLMTPDSAMKITSRIFVQDGMYGFSRGILPRMLSIVPRLTFLKALSEEFVPLISKGLENGADWIESCSRK